VFYLHGEGPSTKRAGNLFAISNIEALEGIRLNEIWLEQALFNDRIKIRLGPMQADTEFFVAESGGQFLNDVFGYQNTAAANLTQGGPLTR
jgi:porin